MHCIEKPRLYILELCSAVHTYTVEFIRRNSLKASLSRIGDCMHKKNVEGCKLYKKRTLWP